MRKFSEKSWEERKKVLGEPAESAFKRYAQKHGIQFDRYGFDNSPIRGFSKLPEFVRFTPDFACVRKSPFLVECKGAGRGNHVTIKLGILPALEEWNTIAELFIFFYDSDKKKVAIIGFTELMVKIESNNYEIGEWVDWGVAKQHYKIPKSDLVWEDDNG